MVVRIKKVEHGGRSQRALSQIVGGAGVGVAHVPRAGLDADVAATGQCRRAERIEVEGALRLIRRAGHAEGEVRSVRHGIDRVLPGGEEHRVGVHIKQFAVGQAMRAGAAHGDVRSALRIAARRNPREKAAPGSRRQVSGADGEDRGRSHPGHGIDAVAGAPGGEAQIKAVADAQAVAGVGDREHAAELAVGSDR